MKDEPRLLIHPSSFILHPWCSYGPRVWRVRVDAELRDRLLHRAGVELTLLEERVQRGDGHVLRVHLEEPPQRLAGFRAAEAVGAQRQEPAAQVRGQLLRQ